MGGRGKEKGEERLEEEKRRKWRCEVSRDPVQLHIFNNFFLGNAYVLLRSINGMIHGLNIVDNMFSGDASGVHIVQLDKWKQPFRSIKLVIVDRNEVYGGMEIKSTLAKVFLQGHGKRWSHDFSPVLLFHDRIRHVEYSLQVDGSFPHHALRNVSGNRIVIESDTTVQAIVYISVDQSL
ncbi:polygalacturonase QRT3-like protein [Cinnamomum micranthum f. kanehirae]|uniref:Polygalacturonase QRT3-like protein n=1 Tax=Cinnamomum micranthum f. kanehirae TaxID=337451 RepID=A0A3S3N594_9MAGN|nr:polygalacturonase QRT3-like protein [Cinnamomum micranthum f. kanehirae]